eukprot:gb/GECH01014485.1/.p1 GENE.gb/GECH01014485.1/~~gb/GECH01014485.1/.p1  ORF type:complete len:767 (+),score=199.01 gb/GECH01014485.1/:1-2301(+)
MLRSFQKAGVSKFTSNLNINQSKTSSFSFSQNALQRSSLINNNLNTSNFHSTTLKQLSEKEMERLAPMRNIGISAHIDSGKTTLTERILYYTGRIGSIHEVRGKDGIGAKMDSMELEREKGITIQSAATYCQWKDSQINIIDTPGHVDFTVEVERALRVLDGAVLVLCGVGGVQSQSITVDRQMKRYEVPRVCFINKLDRQGAEPFRVIQQLREKLRLNAAAVQIPLGLEDQLQGVIDLVSMKTFRFKGDFGRELTVEDEIPEDKKEEVAEKRRELIEKLGEFDGTIEERYLMEEEPSEDEVRAAIRKGVIDLQFTPVFMGSAFKNKGVQPLLDGVVDYLPNPGQVTNYANVVKPGEEDAKEHDKAMLESDSSKELVGLAFKLEESQYGQLTYMRVYQGTLKRGDTIYNTRENKRRIKVPRLVRMHSNEMEEVNNVKAGEICAMFGVDCASGDTFTSGSMYSLESMYVPDPVVSLSVEPDNRSDPAFSKALQRFQREDPTFRVKLDAESGQTIISGMGELHLDIYVERMRREYKCPVKTGRPYVAYRETILNEGRFDYLHKKQTGGAGQYARVIGRIEPLPPDHPEKFEFHNHVVGNNIPPNFIAACEKGFREATVKGPIIGCPVWGARVILEDGATHVVDSSELAFKTACMHAFKQAFQNGGEGLLEPIMNVEASIPSEYQGSVIASLTKRRGSIRDTGTSLDYTVIYANVPLGEMFGYSTELRSMTQGKGEFTMEYMQHDRVPPQVTQQVIKRHQAEQEQKEKK